MTGRKSAKGTILVDIVDDEVWKAAEKKLEEGLAVYTVDDFKTEMMQLLREENRQLEATNHALVIERARLRNQLADERSALKALIEREQATEEG